MFKERCFSGVDVIVMSFGFCLNACSPDKWETELMLSDLAKCPYFAGKLRVNQRSVWIIFFDTEMSRGGCGPGFHSGGICPEHNLSCTRLPAVHLFVNLDLILSWGTEAKAVSQELTLTTTNP